MAKNSHSLSVLTFHRKQEYLTRMLLVANLVRAKLCEKSRKMTETLANWYSSDRAQQELSNEYQQDRVWIDFKHLSDFISCVKIAAELKGLKEPNKKRHHLFNELLFLLTVTTKMESVNKQVIIW